MRLCSASNAVVPSSSLLRFLRFQAEELCFFAPSCVAASSFPPSQKTGSNTRPVSQRLPNKTRFLTTTSRKQATIESFLLPLDFLRPSRHGLPPFPSSASSHRIDKLDLSQGKPSLNRLRSTDARPLLSKFWTHKERKEKPRLKSTDLPPLPSFLDDYGGASIGRNKSVKAANELKLRCTEFDKDGKVTLMDGEFKKTELIAKVWHHSWGKNQCELISDAI